MRERLCFKLQGQRLGIGPAKCYFCRLGISWNQAYRETMNAPARIRADTVPIGIGFYTIPEAARLLRIPARNIKRWLGGYTHRNNGLSVDIPPLWTPQLPRFGNQIELGFRDLIELRFVQAFINAGLGLKSIRHLIETARACVKDERPFSTSRFQTDGRTIFLDTINQFGEAELLDLKKRQYTMKHVIERTFKDLDFGDDAVMLWRPFQGKNTIVIDPNRAFGQPILADYGVSTIALAQAAKAEGSVGRAAQIFEVPTGVAREAVKFEDFLLAA